MNAKRDKLKKIRKEKKETTICWLGFSESFSCVGIVKRFFFFPEFSEETRVWDFEKVFF